MARHSYHVVEFKERPFFGIEKYVCIPDSWIHWRDEAGSDAIVAYPSFRIQGLNNMVINNDRYLEIWKLYKGFRKHSTDSYERAMRFIQTKKDEPDIRLDLDNLYDHLEKLKRRVKQFEGKRDANGNTSMFVDSGDEEGCTHKTAQPPFILPADYDPNDSTWTLKHRKFKEGLVEIKQYARDKVYIDSRAFEMCKRSSNDCDDLARHLLEGVFTMSALKVCSWSGRRGRSGKGRPGLDKCAREQLVTCVLEIGHERGWPADKRKVVISLQKRLQRIREE